MSDNKSADNPYVTESNEAIRFKFIRDVKDIEDETLAFAPEMSHQIFGIAEKIYGYKDLSIKLYFAASTLFPYLEINYKEKISSTKADDIEETLVKKLEILFERNINVFSQKLLEEHKFRPPGKLKNKFSLSGKNYEIYNCDLGAKGFKALHDRLQTFLLWFIDAASFIDADDPKWTFFVIYEKVTNSDNEMYCVLGYVSIYEYYAYPEHIRPRVSQVLVFPPFQGLGLGAKLIECVYAYYRNNPAVKDITMEDASVDLQALRDFIDCGQVLESIPEFGKLEKTPPKRLIDEATNRLKLNKKQILRISEILRLRNCPPAEKEKYRRFRDDVIHRLHLPIKLGQDRLARASKYMLPQEFEVLKSSVNLSEETKKETLEKAFQELEQQYTRVIDRLNNPK